MTLLHDYLNTRNQQGFVRLLDASVSANASTGGLSTSGGKSWNKSGMNSVHLQVDVNARDWLGRTALHLACTSLENIEFVRALLKHPGINLNLPDTESHWTALHRALYNANFPAALLLLQRNDIDTTLKDLEGYTAYDLYNSTVDNSKPDISEEGKRRGELFTWGANRNAALGLGDGNDRVYPEQVVLQPQEALNSSGNDSAPKDKEDRAWARTVDARFAPVHVSKVCMSKLHTALVTEERTGNVRVCGFGSGGRLGPTQHTLYTPTPLSALSSTKIVSLALGQDHTLALTSAGEVLSWGLGRFGQLGYVIESTGGFKGEASMQPTPKRVYGPLKKEIVRGVAATKTASACWTSEVVYTWGTNGGQLGYDRSTNPLQIQPRIVSLITKPVQDIALGENVMACLLITQQVECIWNDRHVRVNFPAHIFPSEIQPYRPPQATKDSDIKKITTCDDVFAALSSNGEVFIFSAPNTPSSSSEQNQRSASAGFKPQRIWALRKKFSAVRDVAVGADGSIVVCTESGHVFARSRSSGKGAQSGGVGKFHCVPNLQRITSVCANSTGAFGALRVDYRPKEIVLVGNGINKDLATVQPYLALFKPPEEDIRMKIPGEVVGGGIIDDTFFPGLDMEGDADEEKDEGDVDIVNDVEALKELCEVLVWEKEMRKQGGGTVSAFNDGRRLPHGADALMHIQSVGTTFPVHRVILAARCPALYAVLSRSPGSHTIQDPKPPSGTTTPVSIRLMVSKTPVLAGKQLPRLSVSGCHPLSVLILLRYLYSDELLAIWDHRVFTAVARQLTIAKASAPQIKFELQALARALTLPLLSAALEPPVKRNPVRSMEQAMTKLFDVAQGFDFNAPSSLIRDPLAPDVVLQFADRDVLCHSTILRSRSELFGSFFDENEWTRKRRDGYGMVKMNMRHLSWHIMQYVVKFICCGADLEMFDYLDFTESMDDVLQFAFDVMAAANELLLDRLVLLCSSIILKFTNLYTACSILADATHFNAEQLVERVQSYVTVNMEAFLESRMLSDIPHALVKQLSGFVKQKQADKSPVSRSGKITQAAMEKHANWLAQQDIPQPIVTKASRWPLRRDSKLSPPTPSRRPSRASFSAAPPPDSPNVLPPQTLRRPPSCDDIFEMDDSDVAAEALQTQHPIEQLPVSPSPAVWKPSSRPRVDMKTVMAEAAAGQLSQRETPFSTPNASSSNLVVPAQTIARKSSWNDVPRTPPRTSQMRVPGGSPWKTPAEAAATRPSPPGTPGPSAHAQSSAPTPPRPKPSNVSSSKPAAPSTPQQPSQPGLGPVITPTRQPGSKSSSTVRNVSGGKAWTLPPVQPVTATSPPTTGISFVAIQHSQLEQVPDVSKDKRSLREIQEEEQARQTEEDFMKWWNAEEERIRQEEEALAQFQAASAQQNIPRGGGGGRGGRPHAKGKSGGRGGKGGKKGEKPAEGSGDGGKKGDKHEAEGSSSKSRDDSRFIQDSTTPSQPRHRPRKPAHQKVNAAA